MTAIIQTRLDLLAQLLRDARVRHVRTDHGLQYNTTKFKTAYMYASYQNGGFYTAILFDKDGKATRLRTNTGWNNFTLKNSLEHLFADIEVIDHAWMGAGERLEALGLEL